MASNIFFHSIITTLLLAYFTAGCVSANKINRSFINSEQNSVQILGIEQLLYDLENLRIPLIKFNAEYGKWPQDYLVLQKFANSNNIDITLKSINNVVFTDPDDRNLLIKFSYNLNPFRRLAEPKKPILTSGSITISPDGEGFGELHIEPASENFKRIESLL